MRTEIIINLDNRHISFAVDGKECICRPLTEVEMQPVKEAAKSDRLQIEESEKGCGVLVAFYTLEILKIIKYGIDGSLAGCLGKI